MSAARRHSIRKARRPIHPPPARVAIGALRATTNAGRVEAGCCATLMRGVALGLETASRPVRRSASRLLSPPLAPGTKARLRETRNDTKRTAAILLARKSAKGCEMARKGARGCRRPRAAEGFFRAGEGEVAGGEIRGILRFEPIKSMVSRGLSPIGAGWGRKRGLKLVTQSPCYALPNFATM